MPRPSAWRRYLRFWGPDVDADVDDEIRFHMETRVEALVERGLAPDAARAQALEEFGDVRAVRERLRAIDRRLLERRRRTERWARFAQEIRHALRRLVRQPGFSVPAAVTLALGIGATAAIFALLQAVVLRPLPYPAAGRLVRLWSAVPGIGPEERWALAKGQYLAYRREARTLDEMALYQLSAATLGAEAAGGGGGRRSRRGRRA